MRKSLTFSQKIDLSPIANGTGVMSICDINQPDKVTGKFEVINQRDWKVPEFKDSAKDLLCMAFTCKNECNKCVVTRILEES